MSTEEIRRGLDGVHALDAAQAEESLQRRIADREVLDELRRTGFTGPRYARLAEELAAYGMPVMRGWMYSGYIFKLTAGRGLNLHPSVEELDDVTCDSDVREELAIMTVARALPSFRERALVNGGWDSDAGASLTTYFMGACTFVFPNEFRRHRAQRGRWRRQDVREMLTRDQDEHHVTDPARIAVGQIRVRDDLARLDDRARAIVALRIEGYALEEIVEMLGETSVRAVEGVLYRWRVDEKARLQEGADL